MNQVVGTIEKDPLNIWEPIQKFKGIFYKNLLGSRCLWQFKGFNHILISLLDIDRFLEGSLND